ncbi:MAG: hypothetical protein ACXW1U_14285 [Methylobacter sp.]
MKAVTTRFQTRIGSWLPGGATWSEEGTNFSVYSHEAMNTKSGCFSRTFQVAIGQNSSAAVPQVR